MHGREDDENNIFLYFTKKKLLFEITLFNTECGGNRFRACDLLNS